MSVFTGRGFVSGATMRFSRVSGPVQDMQIWNASSNGYSFVISYESLAIPAFMGIQALWFHGVRSIKTDPR